MVLAAIYARISLDRHEGEGVARQLDDSRQLAKERGWDTVEYVDNDISAYRGARRPQWERLLADLHAGHVGAVVAYHPDRLYRRLLDLEDLIDAIEAASAHVATVRAGDIDLSTATGRMQARIIAAVARHESERMGERVSRAKQERAAQGRPSGGGQRPFGLTADRQSIVPEEAAEIRQCAANLLAGSRWLTEARRLNAAGVQTTAGNYWTGSALQRVVNSPHVAGLRAYQGRIVGPSTSPVILDRDTWDVLRHSAEKARTGRPPSDRYLLTGLIRCAACDRRMFGWDDHGTIIYRCSPAQTATGKGCGRSVIAAKLDEYVTGTVAGWINDPESMRHIRAYLDHDQEPDGHAHAEIEAIEQRRARLSERWAEGAVSDAEYDAARQVLVRLQSEAEANLGPPKQTGTRPAAVAKVVAGWNEPSTRAQDRAAISALMVTPLLIGPGRAPGRRPLPIEQRVELTPLWLAS